MRSTHLLHRTQLFLQSRWIRQLPCLVIATTTLCFISFPAQAKNLSEKIVAMERGLEQEFEEYFGEDLADVTQAPADIAKTLRRIGQETGTNPAVLWAIPRGDHLHLVLITPAGEPIVRDLYDVPDALLKETVEDFHVEMHSSPAATHMQAAQQLHDWMVEPFEEKHLQAEGIDTILFCLGDGLRSLPLVALHDGHQFLLEKYSLTRIPAFNLIQTAYRAFEEGRVLAMGASEFKLQNPLPAVPTELNSVLEGWQSAYSYSAESLGQPYLNQEFTLSNLQALIKSQSPEIVHLATHAKFNRGTPASSYIQLWDTQLTLSDIRKVNWHTPSIELLVLSACQTAVGDHNAELGFAGLALQSGVKSVLASIWSVSDTGTLALMNEFYRGIGAAPTKAEALRQAQLKMLRGEIRIEGDRLVSGDDSIALPKALAYEQLSDLSAPYSSVDRLDGQRRRPFYPTGLDLRWWAVPGSSVWLFKTKSLHATFVRCVKSFLMAISAGSTSSNCSTHLSE